MTSASFILHGNKWTNYSRLNSHSIGTGRARPSVHLREWHLTDANCMAVRTTNIEAIDIILRLFYPELHQMQYTLHPMANKLTYKTTKLHMNHSQAHYRSVQHIMGEHQHNKTIRAWILKNVIPGSYFELTLSKYWQLLSVSVLP